MQHGVAGDPFAELKEVHGHYKVFDAHYENVGKVDDLFVDAEDRPIYIGLKTGMLGTRSILVPMEIVRVNDRRRVVEISESKENMEHAPSLENDAELTPEIEDGIRRFFGLGGRHDPAPRREEPVTDSGLLPDERVDLVPGERKIPGSPAKPPVVPAGSPTGEPRPVIEEVGTEWTRGPEGHGTKARRLGR